MGGGALLSAPPRSSLHLFYALYLFVPSARKSVTSIASRVPTVFCVAPRAKVEKAMMIIATSNTSLSAYDVPFVRRKGARGVCVCE